MAYTSRKKLRRGSVSILLSVVVVLSAILCNAIVTTLASRYNWYVNMNTTPSYPVTGNCYQFLDTYVVPQMKDQDTPIEIIFCDEKENILADATQKAIYKTANEILDAYPDMVDISFLNIWERPKEARSYGVTASTAVVVKHKDQHRVCNLADFFVFSAKDASTPIAYSGEKRFAIAMKAVVSEDNPVCYFTLNHGEAFPDYALLSAATDAGYMVNYLDALNFDIPQDCDLLITYNPAQDFTHIDGVSGNSEIDKLDAYMKNGGKYMVFVSADTFLAGGFENLENYLATWGVTFDHKASTTIEDQEDCYAIRDTAHALTTDGYTLVGKTPNKGTTGGDIMAAVDGTIRIANATSISVADGFVKNTAGDYVNGEYTLTPLLTSYAGAEAWANGRAVDRTQEGYNFVTLSKRSSDNASLLACSSIDFASEASMYPIAFDNSPFFLTAVGAMGKSDIPIHLMAFPIETDTIHILTTSDARNITLALTLIPATVVLATGLIILIRRKYA